MPRTVTPDQQWLAEIYKELHRLVLAVERLDRRLRDAETESPVDEDEKRGDAEE